MRLEPFFCLIMSVLLLAAQRGQAQEVTAVSLQDCNVLQSTEFLNDGGNASSALPVGEPFTALMTGNFEALSAALETLESELWHLTYQAVLAGCTPQTEDDAAIIQLLQNEPGFQETSQASAFSAQWQRQFVLWELMLEQSADKQDAQALQSLVDTLSNTLDQGRLPGSKQAKSTAMELFEAEWPGGVQLLSARAQAELALLQDDPDGFETALDAFDTSGRTLKEQFDRCHLTGTASHGIYGSLWRALTPYYEMQARAEQLASRPGWRPSAQAVAEQYSLYTQTTVPAEAVAPLLRGGAFLSMRTELQYRLQEIERAAEEFESCLSLRDSVLIYRLNLLNLSDAYNAAALQIMRGSESLAATEQKEAETLAKQWSDKAEALAELTHRLG